MVDQKKKGILSRLFGPSKSCCCDMKIEEVTETEQSGASAPSGESSSGGERRQDEKASSD